jgi:Mg2+-importing ATPase
MSEPRDPIGDAAAAPAAAFWRDGPAPVLRRLDSRAEGLTTTEAEARLARHGRNSWDPQGGPSLLRRIGHKLLNPLIAILLVAAAVSGLSGDVASFVIIVLVISVSLVLDIVQEQTAEAAVAALQRSVAVTADVRRDGALRALPVEALVPGDVVELRTGDLVPADGLVLAASDAQVNESLLTGEPFPVAKTTEACASDSPADARNALFSGTAMAGGSAVLLVVETGARTRFGGIAAALAGNPPPTALEQGVHRLGLLILRLTVFLTLFVLLAHLAAGRPAMDSFLFAVALAVGLTPELLPMIMTVTLARGAIRMARQRVIVKRLSAVHDLGAMDVMCVDKTGTLTAARITLAGQIDPSGAATDEVLDLAALNSVLQTGARSALDEAILAAAGPADPAAVRVAEVPFDFRRRCVSVLVAQGGARRLIVKGAPEAVIARCTAVQTPSGAAPLDAAKRAALDDLERREAADGYRLLAVAHRPLDAAVAEVGPADERDLVLAGFCRFADPPKPDAAAAIAGLRDLGVTLKVISGDHAEVVRHVAAAVGLPTRTLLTGSEIARLSDGALAAQARGTDLFARVDPDQKSRIIRALQRRGHVVGFMGDGVNDAPAIHAAHVGLSVEGATEIARSAADIILLAPDLSVLGQGVREGRRTFANILKYVRMGTSSNFGNMLSMALASLVLPFLPLLPIQILLNNLVYDLSEIGIPFDDVDADDVAAPHAWDMGSILRYTVVMGAVSSLFDIATFLLLLVVFQADAGSFRTGWFLESIATQILVIFLIRTRGHCWASRPHPLLVATSLGALLGALLLVLGPLRGWLGFVPLTPGLGLALGAIVAGYLVAAEVLKRLALGRWPHRAAGHHHHRRHLGR